MTFPAQRYASACTRVTLIRLTMLLNMAVEVVLASECSVANTTHKLGWAVDSLFVARTVLFPRE